MIITIDFPHRSAVQEYGQISLIVKMTPIHVKIQFYHVYHKWKMVKAKRQLLEYKKLKQIINWIHTA